MWNICFAYEPGEEGSPLAMAKAVPSLGAGREGENHAT